jgi:hypothetical protein
VETVVDLDGHRLFSLDVDLELAWGVTNSEPGSSSSDVRSMARLPSAKLITLNGRRRFLEELVAVSISLPGSSLMVIPGSALMGGAPWK